MLRSDLLTLSEKARQTYGKKASHQIIEVESPSITTLNKEQQKELIGSSFASYRDRVEDAASNLAFYRDGISYLQQKVEELQGVTQGEFTESQMKELESWKEKLEPEKWEQFEKDYKEFLVKDANEKLEVYTKTLAQYKDGAKEILNTHLNMANGFVNIKENQYDSKTWQALQSAMGGFISESSKLVSGLKGSESTAADVLASIDDAAAALKDLSGRLSAGYQEYTGQEMGDYVSSGLSSNAGEMIERTMLFNRELGQNIDPRLNIAVDKTVKVF